MDSKQEITYYQIKPKYREYKGHRFFKFNPFSEWVIQVKTASGLDDRKGKSRGIGITMISRTTFLSNYISITYVEPTNKKVFDKMFETVVNQLKTV